MSDPGIGGKTQFRGFSRKIKKSLYFSHISSKYELRLSKDLRIFKRESYNSKMKQKDC